MEKQVVPSVGDYWEFSTFMQNHQCPTDSVEGTYYSINLKNRDKNIYKSTVSMYREMRYAFVQAINKIMKEQLVRLVKDSCVSCRRKQFPHLRQLEKKHTCIEFNKRMVSALIFYENEALRIMKYSTLIQKKIETQYLQNLFYSTRLCPCEMLHQNPYGRDWNKIFENTEILYQIYLYAYEENRNFSI